MALTAGARIGPFLVKSSLGEGGMGVVFRALDTKLQREVALKLLPDHFADDPERLVRFQREAQVLASLNHPNIAQIYGLEESGNTRCIVMELVEGETLQERLKRGPILIDEALPIARQIAEALEAAHERGIVHRDLKPANIKLTPDGKVKVLDFGLAKAFQEQQPTTLSNSPTLVGASVPGVILGTAAYMSPEQAKGKEADRSSDIWAFGCVLYEMLTARAAFEGETIGEILAGVMKSEPDWHRLPAEVPENIRRLLRRCLQKDRKVRLHDMADARIEITEWQNEPTKTIPTPTKSWLRSQRFFWAAFTVCFLALTGVVYLQRAKTPEPVVRSSLLPPEKFSFRPLSSGPVAVSPDGRRVVFAAASSDGKVILWVRALDSAGAQPLAGTENGGFPFWSPDSRRIAFFAEQKLKVVDAVGGPVQALCDVTPNPRGGTWNRDGVILFAASPASAILRVSASGGPVTPVTVLDKTVRETTHRWPWFLPDGRHFLYLAATAPGGVRIEDSTLYLGSLDAKEKKMLVRTPAQGVYASGHLLYLRDKTLMAQPFNLRQLDVEGEAFPLAENIDYVGGILGAAFSVSQSGLFVYQAPVPSAGAQLVWLDRAGREAGSVGQAGDYGGGPRVSRDGKKFAIVRVDASRDWDVWLYDIGGGTGTRFTLEPSAERHPIWSPDGRRVIFYSNRNSHYGLYQKSLDDNTEQRLFDSAVDARGTVFTFSLGPTDWSTDGRFIAFNYLNQSGKINPWILPLFGGAKPFPFHPTDFNEGWAQFSPNGRWIAYVSDDSGRFEVYVAPFDYPTSSPRDRWVASAGGGSFPRWRRDGNELFYVAPDGRLMSVEVKERDAAVGLSSPRPLFAFTSSPNPDQGVNLYDVAADGQRFLIVKDAGIGSPISLVLNWPTLKPKP